MSTCLSCPVFNKCHPFIKPTGFPVSHLLILTTLALILAKLPTNKTSIIYNNNNILMYWDMICYSIINWLLNSNFTIASPTKTQMHLDYWENYHLKISTRHNPFPLKSFQGFRWKPVLFQHGIKGTAYLSSTYIITCYPTLFPRTPLVV